MSFIFLFFLISVTTLKLNAYIYPPLVEQISLSEHEEDLCKNCTYDELFSAGRIFKIAGQPEEAMRFFRPALFKLPEELSINWDLGDMYLLNGDFQRGMAGFRARWQRESIHKKKLWNGETVAHKTILVYCQWGFGDTFMYLRYLLLLKNEGARVICICQKPLIQLLSFCTFIDQLIPLGSNEKLPEYDYQTPITYLPEVFGTTIETIPQPIPYLFVSHEHIDYWSERIKDDHHFKIGLCWNGENRPDPQTWTRSIALEKLVPILQLPNTTFYSLQTGSGLEQINTLPSTCSINILDDNFDKDHGAFVDTAALMKNLDLVITIDTSIAHLAGALGIPVWVMIPYANEWRFFRDRADSPWYPTMRLFRQSARNDWQTPIEQIMISLKSFIDEKYS